MSTAMMRSDLPFPVRRGKVRDVYDLGDALLIVATDRISAYDCVMPNGIPDKGKILTALSLFWFDLFSSDRTGAGRAPLSASSAEPKVSFENHLIATEVDAYPPQVQRHRNQLQGRSMLVQKAAVVPIECVARGYLAGSGWKEYQNSRSVCGVKLPPGLRQCDKLPEPIFTPATKEESGHDINIAFDEAVRRVGERVAGVLRDRTLALYSAAADYAARRGVLIADTKFEFGALADGRIILIDEVLTPDSSRFWPADQFEPGRDQPSFDKQFVRDYLDSLREWDKTPPAPALPPDVVEGTRQRYLQAYQLLTGRALSL